MLAIHQARFAIIEDPKWNVGVPFCYKDISNDQERSTSG